MLRTILKASKELRNDFRGGKCTVHDVGYPDVSVEGFYCIEIYFTETLFIEERSLIDVLQNLIN